MVTGFAEIASGGIAEISCGRKHVFSTMDAVL
jgi:hypothetical protein